MRVMQRYTSIAIAFHWIIAVLIVLNFAAAWIAKWLPRADRMQLMAGHKALGLTVLMLSVLAVLWRLVHPRPPYEPTLKPWEVALARTTHTLFWLLIVALPLTGWMMVSAYGGGEPVRWFGLFDIPGLPFAADETRGSVFHETHEWLAWGMLALFCLHVTGALKHQLIDRDATMARMMPGTRR